jgi:hypothetical protein
VNSKVATGRRLRRVARKSIVVAAAAVGLVCGPASAALQTISGTNFDVQYDDALLGLFGTPNLVGNNIFFVPPAFSAQSENGAGIATTTSFINLTLIAKQGFSFGALSLTERGDYRLNSPGSSVFVGGQLIAFDPTDLGSYSFDSIDPNPSTPMNIIDNTLKPWRADASLDLSSSPFFDPRRLEVQIQNQLSASTSLADGAGSLAFIQKKFTGAPITLEVMPIPEPETPVLVAAGFAILALFTRRRR